MKIHHLRNATFVIEAGKQFVLVDPMLSEKGMLPPFSYFKYKAQRNPIVALPDNAIEILNKVTLCLITHSQKFGIKALQHTDHLDDAGESFLRSKGIPVVTRKQDAAYLKNKGLNVALAADYWMPSQLLGGTITAVPALHGHGWIHTFMANGAGFHLHLPGEPSIYISGDTVYTKEVERALSELKPDIAVIPCGGACLDVGGPILMPLEEIIIFIQKAPNRVIANHLEALNHCPLTRAELLHNLEQSGLKAKTYVPKNGEVITIDMETLQSSQADAE